MLQIRPSSACAAVLALPLLGMTAAASADGVDASLAGRIEQLAQQGAQAAMPPQARVEVQVGQLDPRLKLAPCQQIQPYLPPGLSMWGKTRIGLRCLDAQNGAGGAGNGAGRWNVSLPVTVKVYAKALVAAAPLPAGTQLAQDHLALAEIDIAAEPGAVFTDAANLVGRQLIRPLAAGDAVRGGSLKQRQWFAAGETVSVRVSGPGYAVAGEGQAMTAGLEGQVVRIRFESGRTVTGRAVGDRQVEVLL